MNNQIDLYENTVLRIFDPKSSDGELLSSKQDHCLHIKVLDCGVGWYLQSVLDGGTVVVKTGDIILTDSNNKIKLMTTKFCQRPLIVKITITNK